MRFRNFDYRPYTKESAAALEKGQVGWYAIFDPSRGASP